MRGRRGLFKILGLALGLVACRRQVAEADMVARVNGEPILKTVFETQLAAQLRRFRGDGGKFPAGIEARVQSSVLRRMIDDEIVAQKAKALQVAISPDEVEARLNEHKARFPAEGFADYLKRSNNTEDNVRHDLALNLLRDRVVERLSDPIEVDEAAMQRHYDENKERYTEPEQVVAQRILLPLPPEASRSERAAALKRANRLLAQARAKGADFAELARQNSQGPEAARGGDLGALTRRQLAPELEEVAFGLKESEVSPVVETKLGLEIVRVSGHRAARLKPFDDVKTGIQGTLWAKAHNEGRLKVLAELRAAAKVETFLKTEEGSAAPLPAAAAAARGMGTVPPGVTVVGRADVPPEAPPAESVRAPP